MPEIQESLCAILAAMSLHYLYTAAIGKV